MKRLDQIINLSLIFFCFNKTSFFAKYSSLFILSSLRFNVQGGGTPPSFANEGLQGHSLVKTLDGIYGDKYPENGCIFQHMTALIILLVIAILLMKIFQNQIVGFIGEHYTAKQVRRISKGVVFRDLYAQGSYGVQQIDIIAVTKKGVLVIEKKTYVGLILGKSHDKKWTVCLPHKRRHSMMNPHHQNFGHIKALEECVPEIKGKCVDLVIFGNNAKLGDNIPSGTIKDFHFKRFYKELPTLLCESEISDISDRIAKLNDQKKELKALHKIKIG